MFHHSISHDTLCRRLPPVIALVTLMISAALTGCDRGQVQTVFTDVAPEATQAPAGHLTKSTPTESPSIEAIGDQLRAGVAELNQRSVAEPSRQAVQSLDFDLKARFDPSDRRPPILAVRLQDNTVFGVPIGLFSDQTLLMRNDGAIQSLLNSDISDKTILTERFQSIDRGELANQLHREFGKRYSIRHEGVYLVVAQPEHMLAWSQRFRSIHHSFQLYCTTRNLPIRPIEFPLTAIVFGTRNEFTRYAHNEGAKLPPTCVGYYSQNSNRIVLYESPTAIAQETLETICHEATHQLAFNTGLHQRLASTPLWVAEGFATMFESPLMSGLQSRQGRSHWPESRKTEWRSLVKRPDVVHQVIDSMIRSDTSFENDSQRAYCLSWAMTAYLSQRRPKQFSQYLSHIASMPPFEKYEPADRQSDFQRIFATDSRMLCKNIFAFLESLP